MKTIAAELTIFIYVSIQYYIYLPIFFSIVLHIFTPCRNVVVHVVISIS